MDDIILVEKKYPPVYSQAQREEMSRMLRQQHASEFFGRIKINLNAEIPITMSGYSSLTSYLFAVVGESRTEEAIKTYHLGTSDERCHNYCKTPNTKSNADAVLWRILTDGTPINGNVIKFDVNGNILQCHRICRSPDCNHYRLGSGFFGGHLLTERKDLVCIVNDELTAILGSMAFHNYRWLAIGHGGELTKRHVELICNYNVMLLPDIHTYGAWQHIICNGQCLKYSDVLARLQTSTNIRNYFLNQIKN